MTPLQTTDFDYALPEELIAQHPAEPRDASRLLVVHRSGDLVRDQLENKVEHRHFSDVTDYLRPGDALVINHTRVIPARLLGTKADTGVPVEVLLLRRHSTTDWEALVRPGRRLKPGTWCTFGGGLLRCEVLRTEAASGGRLIRFHYSGIFEEMLDRLGEMPLPPYIHEKLADPARYQTVYAKEDGSAAAPTAGLHFTDALLARIRGMGVHIVPVLLHVGLGTFRPVKETDVDRHVMHSEYYEVSPGAAQQLNEIRSRGGRIICVGTTSVRTLETVADEKGIIHPGAGDTAIFIRPGVPIRAVDGLITNFHLPQSTLLMLVSAFLGRERTLSLYQAAVAARYRFFSFGDAMLILPEKT